MACSACQRRREKLKELARKAAKALGYTDEQVTAAFGGDNRLLTEIRERIAIEVEHLPPDEAQAEYDRRTAATGNDERDM